MLQCSTDTVTNVLHTIDRIQTLNSSNLHSCTLSSGKNLAECLNSVIKEIIFIKKQQKLQKFTFLIYYCLYFCYLLEYWKNIDDMMTS